MKDADVWLDYEIAGNENNNTDFKDEDAEDKLIDDILERMKNMVGILEGMTNTVSYTYRRIKDENKKKLEESNKSLRENYIKLCESVFYSDTGDKIDESSSD